MGHAQRFPRTQDDGIKTFNIFHKPFFPRKKESAHFFKKRKPLSSLVVEEGAVKTLKLMLCVCSPSLPISLYHLFSPVHLRWLLLACGKGRRRRKEEEAASNRLWAKATTATIYCRGSPLRPRQATLHPPLLCMENGELRFSKAYPVDTAEGRKEKFIFYEKGKFLHDADESLKIRGESKEEVPLS